MKTILIEEVANGWIVRNNHPAFIATCCPSVDVHVYRSIHELADELPKLLATEEHPPCPAPSPEEIKQAREEELKSACTIIDKAKA